MNLIYCELYSLRSMALSAQTDLQAHNQRGNAMHKRRKLNRREDQPPTGRMNIDSQARRVREYVVRCLRGQAAPGASGGNRPLGSVLTAQNYTALLPTLWWLLNQTNDYLDGVPEVLLAILEHARKCGSKSSAKTAK